MAKVSKKQKPAARGAATAKTATANTGRARSRDGSAFGRYLGESERPWASLLFLLPLLLAYELYVAGVFSGRPGGISGHHPPRITAFILIEEMFRLFGAAGEHLPAIALVGMLLSAHVVRRDSWRVRLGVLGGMVFESVAWAAPLLVIGWGLARLLPLSRAGHGSNFLFLSLGAGIYEEMLFRLIGVTLLVAVMRDGFHWRPSVAVAVAVVTAGIFFSLYHYLGTGERFLIGPAVFRGLAGIYLGSIYTLRGFGVTAGSHAAYDLAIACFY